MEIGPHILQQLCGYCSALFPLRLAPRNTRIEHHATAGDFIAAAEHTACALCAAMRLDLPLQDLQQRYPQITPAELDAAEFKISVTSLSAAGRQSSGEEPDPTNTLHHQIEDATLSMRLQLRTSKYSSYQEWWTVVAACNITASARIHADLPKVWTIPQATTSVPDKLVVIGSWLRLCEEAHALCRMTSPDQHGALPKRLLALAPASSKTPSRLVYSRDIAAGEMLRGLKYVALSHCWGSGMPLRTLRENLKQLQRAIPGCDGPWTGGPGRIPWTFREAIDICRSLSIKYIWIDSLCIVQDDSEDASDSSQGCFVGLEQGVVAKSHVPQVARFHVQVPLRGGIASNAAEQIQTQDSESDTRSGDSLLVRVYEDSIIRQTRDAALNQRGWTLQEQVLSRRVLHCTFPELHWQCTSCYVTEARVELHGDGSPRTGYLKTRHEVELGTTTTTSQNFSAAAGETMHRAWCLWMETYSRRKFTFAADRLAALSGMVQQTAATTGYTHLLGCWEETLCNDLSWTIRTSSWPGNDSPHTRIDSKEDMLPEIPSWSWLSRFDDIALNPWYSRPDDQSPHESFAHTSLVDKHILWSGIPLVSELLCAELLLRGPVKRSRLTTMPPGKIHDPPGLCVYDEMQDRPADLPPSWRCMGGLDRRTADGGHQYLDGNYDCLLLRSHRSTAKKTPGRETFNDTEMFLILEPVPPGELRERMATGASRPFPGPPLPCYRRIGIANLLAVRTGPHFDGVQDMTIRLI
ncbi:uncharacterized protein B0I36DRAFT_363426 [Microdochium trichocladiopsis]|uniref:Heterokaryon incompatibility domain-containing protein n=1 Tax=Microdochium trichocladiopsis TaxID=1682393 RepID=A0A9P8Y3A0_9PEZI|nr:uncharacterized protein B0I36DRAFT_363426 [Microdochium trichocladiopsis]KAH7028802.1 hypothetical protein B0I36DRAFT_363426 [Microdochium trichocladiopsis]